MIRRFFTLLLVCLMLTNQGILPAHEHHESDFAESSGDSSRPHLSRLHFHFYVGENCRERTTHDEGRDPVHHLHCDLAHHSRAKAIAPAGDHDAAWHEAGDHDDTAVYIANPVAFTSEANSFGSPLANDIVSGRVACVAERGAQKLSRLVCRAPVFGANCPIYLSLRSLRI